MSVRRCPVQDARRRPACGAAQARALAPLLLALYATLVPVASSGCRAFDASLLDGGGDAGGACVPRHPPPRPDSGGGADAGELLFALRDARLDQAADWETIGYDLDGLCTQEPEPRAECHPPDTMGGVELDGVDGTDNVVGRSVFPIVLILLGQLEGPVRQSEEAARGVMLLRIRGYDGRPDDPQVDVAIAQAAYGSAALPGGLPPALPADGSPPPPPVWDGSDFFWGARSAFLRGDEERPLVEDDNAYVSGGTLVVRPPDRTPFLFVGPGFSFVLRISGGLLTARISPDSVTLDQVVLAGRWSVLDLTESLSSLGFCASTENRDRIVRLLDLSADVRATPGTGGEAVPCDALSVGVELTGFRVHSAGLATAPPPPVACP